MKITPQILTAPYEMERGKYAICIFTFGGDSGCLATCVERLHKLQYPRNFEIFVFDDGQNPLEQVPANVYYQRTYFNRNGNLNGTECAHGILMALLHAARQARAEYVMKIDSDMLVLNFERFLKPLKENPLSVIGFKLNDKMQYAAGVCYAMPVEGLYNAVKGFSAWYTRESETEEFAPHCPEDWGVTRSVSAINDYKLILFNQVTNPEHWLLSPFNYDEILLDDDGKPNIHPLIFQRFMIYDFINFGNRYQLTCENAREIASDCMSQYLTFLKESAQRPTE